jgi:O-antigen ligase
MDNKMDAPLTSLEDRVVADVAQKVSDGDVVHRILTGIMAVIGAILLVRHRKRIRLNWPIAALCLAYMGWIACGVFTADDPALTIRRLGGFLLTLLLCGGCALHMDADTNSLFAAAVPTLTLIPDVIAELRCHGFEALTADGRFGGTYPHPNVAAAMLAIPVIVYSWFALRKHGYARLGFATLAFVTFVFFALTRSRTSLVAVLSALGFSLAIMLLRHQRHKLARLFALAVLFVGATGLAALAANAAGFNLMAPFKSNRDVGDPTTLTGRVDLWKTCLDYAYEHPILGYGFGGFWSAKRIEDISEEQQWPINQAHSAYIEEALDLGFPGAFLYTAALFTCLIVCTLRYFRYQDSFGVWAAILVFIAINGFAEALSLPPGFLSFVVSIMAAHLALQKAPGSRGSIAANRSQPFNLSLRFYSPAPLHHGLAAGQRQTS